MVKKAKRKDGDIHQCKLLEYQNRHIEFCVSDSDDIPTYNRQFPEVSWYNSRWRLIIPDSSTGTGDKVFADYVLFCPCCGKDFRTETIGCVVGKPQLAKLLKNAKKRGKR